VITLQDRDHEVETLYASLNAPRPVLIVLSGPSGVGKDSILQGLKQTNYPFYFVVTATTRPIRAIERDGVDYHFVSVGEFAGMIEKDELLEYAISSSTAIIRASPRSMCARRSPAGRM
jgi:guanylate kinase